MLTRNGLNLSGNPNRFLGAASVLVVNRANWGTNGSIRNIWAGQATVIGGNSIADTAAYPNGHEPPSSFVMAPKGGGLSCYNNIEGEGDLDITSLTMGVALSSNLTGSGTISSSTLSLIVQLAAAITGDGSLTANMQAVAALTAALSGSGDVTASNLSLIVSLLAALTGAGDLTATLRGTANMEADIVVTGDVLSTANVASAIWGVAASLYNAADTMGQKQNNVMRLRKNVAFSNFAFQMFDDTNHLPMTGLTITSQRSLDGGVFAGATNSATEIGNGWYKLNLSAADMNADAIILRFTASGADDTSLFLATQD